VLYHAGWVGLDTGNVAIDPGIPPIHRDRLGRAVAWNAAADLYQSCGLVVADDRVQHLRFDVAEKPRAPRSERLIDGVPIVWVTADLLLKWRTHTSQIVYLLVEIDLNPRHCGWLCPEIGGALQLYDVRHWSVVVRWNNVDAKTDAELVHDKVQSLQPVAEKPARRNVSVLNKRRH
jgi:hypothetical protein